VERGGTMTAEELLEARMTVERWLAPSAYQHVHTALGEIVQHLAAQGATVAVLRADNERLERTIHLEAERHRDNILRMDAAEERSRLLLDAKNHWADRARSAESRLAAIRGRGDDLSSVAARSDLEAFRRWVLESAAPKEADTSSCYCSVGHLVTPCLSSRHPCSPTCTHDDAATPGHPERVKELSAAFNASTSPESLANGYVRVTDTATLFGARDEAPTHPAEITRREGFNEGAEAMREAFRNGGEVTTASLEEAAFDRGAKAMRAACFEAAQDLCAKEGMSPAFWAMLRAAIEGAAP
jgi:hypothetical protein